MFYEEKVIGGVLHWRSNPKDEFKPFSAQRLTEMLQEARRQLAASEEALRDAGYGL